MDREALSAIIGILESAMADDTIGVSVTTHLISAYNHLVTAESLLNPAEPMIVDTMDDSWLDACICTDDDEFFRRLGLS